MKNQLREFVALTCFAVALSSSAVFAQDLLDSKVRADIPFDFYAGDQRVPAGTYMFSLSEDRYATIRNQQTGRTYWVLAKSTDMERNNQVVVTFDVVGDVHILHALQKDDASVSFFESTPLLAKAGVVSTTTIAGIH